MFIYARALRYFRPYFWPTLTGLVLTFVAIIVNSLKPWPFKYIVDGVLPSDVTQGSEQARAFIKHWLSGSAPPEQIAFCSPPHFGGSERARRSHHPRRQLSFH